MNLYAHPRRHLRLDRLAVCVALTLPCAASLAAEADIAEPKPQVLPKVEISGHRLGETTDGTGSYTSGRARTATPLSMSLRDTPQSVSVITQQRIEDQALLSVTDVVNNVTGVSVNQYETNRAGFTARGFDITNLQIDGIASTWDQAWSAGEVAGSLAIYDRVEVVRGATGLMTGAGNPSAAINLMRKRASAKQLTGSVEVSVGSWNQRRALIDLSSPLNQAGTVRGRVTAEADRSDSWVDLASNRSKTFYATIEADLGASTWLAAGISHQQTSPTGPMWGGLPYWYTDGTKTNWDASKTSAAGWTRWPTDYDSAFVNLEHRFGNGWKLRANASHGDRSSDSYLLYLSGVPDRLTGEGMSAFSGSYATRTKQDDVGLHASGPFALFGRQHEAAFGYLNMKQEFRSDSRAADFGSRDSGVGNFNTWNGNAYPQPAWGAPSFYESAETRQQGWYGMTRLSVTDALKVVLGARATSYEKAGRGLYTPAYAIEHEDELTPYAGIVYDLGDTYSVYASYTDIFQPQNLKDFAGNLLDPVKGKSYEAGIKGEYLGGRVNTSFALFQIRQDKLGQEAGLVDRDGAGALLPETYYRAAAGARSEGFEMEVSGALARGWNVSAGYSQFRARDAAGADVNSVYPRKLLRTFTSYQLPGAWSALTFGAGVNWEGRTYTLDPLAPAGSNGLIEQDSFALVNLMARYDISRQLSAQLNISNALDKRHFGMFAAYGAITHAAPRSASLTLKYRF
ncbi:TonB-dependent siderophore receptor [Massilia eurypsychrophila]|uniref:TonB-dependent siderophore receptor n=1 Tax=Massilia eurypsychrophila TaxID=1485217 RepID=A0A2G8TEJ8_9BURK|nr:TonB-dependent siderophore receptor [Massilia eurypsychrophila]PIL44475.1 TonB-dependent siderophore receptor [Massilia eurypsychrophila]